MLFDTIIYKIKSKTTKSKKITYFTHLFLKLIGK